MMIIIHCYGLYNGNVSLNSFFSNIIVYDMSYDMLKCIVTESIQQNISAYEYTDISFQPVISDIMYGVE